MSEPHDHDQEPTPDTQPSAAPVPPELKSARVRGPLPSSPVERAKLEAEYGQQNELGDRSTQVAFALLFVVPLLIIILALLLLLPFIYSQSTQDPSGIEVQKSSNGMTPTR